MAEKYCKIPTNIFKDNRLTSQDVALLASLFYLSSKSGESDNVKLDTNQINKLTGLSDNEFILSIKRLKNLGWLNLNSSESDQFLQIYDNNQELKQYIKIKLLIPLARDNSYDQPGSQIARSWSKYFGTRVIRYEDVQDLKELVIDGMDEELILEIMEYSGKNATGDPFRYTRSILLDLFKKGILTLEDYEKDKRKRGDNNGFEISRTDRKKEKRDENEIADEYYRKGYR